MGIVKNAIIYTDFLRDMLISVIGINIIAAHHQLCIVLLCHIVHILQHRFFCPVIRIHKIHIGSAGNINRRVSGTWRSTVFFMNDLNSCILCSILVANLSTFVFCSIIHNQQLVICKCLIQNAFDGFTDILFYIVYRHYNADLNVTHSCS